MRYPPLRVVAAATQAGAVALKVNGQGRVPDDTMGGTAPSTPVSLDCPLRLTPVPAIIAIGGSESLRVVSQPGAQVRITVGGGVSRGVAALFVDPSQAAGQPVAGTADADGYRYVVGVGGTGQALLSFPLPADAPLGQAQVWASATCGSATRDATTSFTVQAVASGGAPETIAAHDVAVSPINHLSLALHDALLRGVEPPPLAGSVAHNLLTVSTDANAGVILDATIVSKSVANLGTAADGGTAYASGDDIGMQAAIADTGGSVQFSVPITSTLLTPGRGAVVHLSVTSVAPGAASGTVYLTSFSIREARLRLVVQVPATSRGGLRPRCLVSHRPLGVSICKVLVVADRGAHITGTVALGATVLDPLAPQTAGPGGRALLSFAIPDALGGTRGMAFPGTASVTSTFRGASVTRSAAFTFGAL